jgi:hypothetical protein
MGKKTAGITGEERSTWECTYVVAAGQAIVRPSASDLVESEGRVRPAAGDVLWRTDGRVGRRLPRPARGEGRERAWRVPTADCEQDENSSATPRLAWSG